MNWKIKAYIQKMSAALPDRLGYGLYHSLQKLQGTFRADRVLPRLGVARKMVDLAQQYGRSICGKTFFELGTGWTCGTPLGLWLCGADRVITVDINPYLKEPLVLAELGYLIRHLDAVQRLFGEHAEQTLFRERLARLSQTPPRNLPELFALTGIEYRARFDARRTSWESESVDFYFSWYVLQHIPPASLQDIWRECHRIVRRDGLVMHCVDAGDQFTRADPALTAINFLRYDQATWQHYAGNRFAYHNRLRASDHLELARKSGFEVSTAEVKVDERSLNALQNGFPVHPDFQGKTPEDLATIRLLFVAWKALTDLAR